MNRIIRSRRLTQDEAAKYNRIREQVAEELPALVARYLERTSMKKIIILGGPRTGKSMLADKIAERFGIKTIMRTDSVQDLEWSAASELASAWFNFAGDWIIEGVMAVRALRKWLTNNPEKKLDAQIFYLTKPMAEQTKGQQSLAKGCESIFTEIIDELRIRRIKFRVMPGNPDRVLDLIASANKGENNATPRQD